MDSAACMYRSTTALLGTVDVVKSVPSNTFFNCSKSYTSAVVQYVFTGRILILFMDGAVVVEEVLTLIQYTSGSPEKVYVAQFFTVCFSD